MEGECYVLVWGILHFWQYLYQNHFTLKNDHKPLEWLATISNTYVKKGIFINMLQDFSFKKFHRIGFKHINVYALNQNPMDIIEDEDSRDEI